MIPAIFIPTWRRGFLIYDDRPTSSWWLQITKCQMDIISSSTAILTHLLHDASHVSQHKQCKKYNCHNFHKWPRIERLSKRSLRPGYTFIITIILSLPMRPVFGLQVWSSRVCVRVCVDPELVHPFKPGSPNLDRRCKRLWLRSLLYRRTIGLDLQDQIEYKCKKLHHFEFVHAIIPNQLKVRISKFGPKMHFSTVMIHNNFRLHWLYSSILFSKPVSLFNIFALFF